MKRLLINNIAALMAVSLIALSCAEDALQPGMAPELPPSSTISPTLGNFPYTESERIVLTSTNGNFVLAADNVGFWQTTLEYGLLIPTAAFGGAFEHVLAYNPDLGKWVAEYPIDYNHEQLIAKLSAENKGDTVIWEMHITSKGEFDDFLWFTGASLVDNSEGTWVINGSPAIPSEQLRVFWQQYEDGTISSKYELIDPESPKVGSSIEFGLISDPDFSYYYEISVIAHEGVANDATILYDHASGEGRIRSLSYFDDDEWRCWNANLEDVDCQNVYQ